LLSLLNPNLALPLALTTSLLQISTADIDSWHDELKEDPQYQLAKTVLSRTDMNIVLQSASLFRPFVLFPC
jgi:hypothetical protein